MKYLSKLFTVIILLSFATISCEDNNSTEPQITYLLISERNSGMVYILDIESGDLAELSIFTLDTEDTVSGIRGMTYSPETNSLYAGQNTNAGGMIFQLDGSQRTATLFNDNSNELGAMEWYGISDMTYMPNGELHATTWDMVLDNPVITRFNVDGTRGESVEFGAGGPCCGLGLAALGDNYIVGDWRQFHEIDPEGNVLKTELLSGTFTPSIDLTATFVQNFTWIDDVLYTLVFDANNQQTYVAILDPESGELTQVSEVIMGRYHGLTAVPDLAFR